MDFTPLREVMDTFPGLGIPQSDIVVTLDDKILFRYSVGIEAPPAPDAIYHLYSVSKVITCVAAAQLLEKGKILLSDPICDYLPGFRDMEIRKKNEAGEEYRVPATKLATVRDLFTMTQGCNYNFHSPAMNEMVEKTGGRAPTMAMAEVLGRTAIFAEPGERWHYSLCHDLLAALVEKVSGLRFAEYVRQNIFLPLGMTSSCYHVEDCDMSRMARQYENFNNGDIREIEKTNRFVLGPEHDSGGGGAISSLEDMQKFAAALARGGIGANGARILSPRTISFMTQNHLSPEADAHLRRELPGLRGYNYGLGVRTLADPALAGSLSSPGEFGWSGAAGAYILADPATKVSIYYAQHMLNSMEGITHPRLRNATYACIFR